ncbi:MAG TPA: glycine oxidase ThiO [Verrucomicrobiae bacterium]|nr:glycine oxidase ThiO [Verrucomicrobiae bacterium]
MALHPDVVVVGGGVIGLATAWRAVGAGLRVTVVDPGCRTGASWAAAGMLAPVSEVAYGEEPLLVLSQQAARQYPAFVAELEAASGMAVGYRPCGTLTVAVEPDDRLALADRHRHQLQLGLEVEWLSGRACRELEPLLAPSIQAGTLAAGDHQVETRRLIQALRVAAERGGARLVEGRVAAVRLAEGRVAGVELADGTGVAGDAVVLAAGCWSGTLGGLPPGCLPPVRPVKGQILRLGGAAEAPVLSRTCAALVGGRFVYCVPRADGRIVLGATTEELGFDTTVRAGSVLDLLHDAAEALPVVRELELLEVRAGLRPGSPDNAPLIGPTSVPGLVLATGHHRNGILLAAVTADAVTTVLATGTVPTSMVPFSPRRFPGAAT